MHMFSDRHTHSKMNACTKQLNLQLEWMCSTQTLHFPLSLSLLYTVLHTCTNTYTQKVRIFIYFSFCVFVSGASMWGDLQQGAEWKRARGAWSSVFSTAQTSLALLGPLAASAPCRLTPDYYRDSSMYYCSSGAGTAARNTALAN